MLHIVGFQNCFFACKQHNSFINQKLPLAFTIILRWLSSQLQHHIGRKDLRNFGKFLSDYSSEDSHPCTHHCINLKCYCTIILFACDHNSLQSVISNYYLQGKITAQGNLLLHGPLICCEESAGPNFKGKEFQVFLFEQNIIFSEAVGKKTQFTNPVYIHKAHIQVGLRSC